MAVLIHPTAIIDPHAELDSTVSVGPYSVIGENVKIHANTKVGAHVVIEGYATIGKDNHFYQFSSIGAAPQDKKYAGEPTRVEIGSGNTIREFCTINTGTIQDANVTRIGDDNWIMAYVHIAHDCQLGSHLIMANNASLAGHVRIDDWVFLGGFSTVHQFCRIGAHAMTSFTAAVTQDVPPFVTAAGNRAKPVGINAEGLKRRGFDSKHILAIRRAYKLIYKSKLSFEDAKVALLEQKIVNPAYADSLGLLYSFLLSSTRGIIR